VSKPPRKRNAISNLADMSIKEEHIEAPIEPLHNSFDQKKSTKWDHTMPWPWAKTEQLGRAWEKKNLKDDAWDWDKTEKLGRSWEYQNLRGTGSAKKIKKSSRGPSWEKTEKLANEWLREDRRREKSKKAGRSFWYLQGQPWVRQSKFKWLKKRSERLGLPFGRSIKASLAGPYGGSFAVPKKKSGGTFGPDKRESGPLFWENRCKGKAIFATNFEGLNEDKDVISGINTLTNRPFEIILTSDSANPYAINPKGATNSTTATSMYIWCNYDMIVRLGKFNANVMGRG